MSKYPPGTLEQVGRLKELEGDLDVPRSYDARLLVLWTEGYTVDIRPAAKRVLTGWLNVLDDKEKVAEAVCVISSRQVGGLSGGRQRLANRMTAKVRGAEEWAEIIRWAFAVAAGVNPEVSLNNKTYHPAPLSPLLKIAGLSKDWGPPAENLPVDQWSIAFLREVLATIGEDEMERVRLVHARLARLAASLDGVSLKALPRIARRTLAARGVKVTQDTIALLRDMWSITDIRLAFIPGIALVLRGAGENVEGWLSLAEAAVAMLPKGEVEDQAASLGGRRRARPA